MQRSDKVRRPTGVSGQRVVISGLQRRGSTEASRRRSALERRTRRRPPIRIQRAEVYWPRKLGLARVTITPESPQMKPTLEATLEEAARYGGGWWPGKLCPSFAGGRRGDAAVTRGTHAALSAAGSVYAG